MIKQPSTLSFWRSILLITAMLIPLSIWQLVALAGELEVLLLASKSWMGLLLLLAFVGLSIWLLLGVSYHHAAKKRFLLCRQCRSNFSAECHFNRGYRIAIYSA